MNSNDLQSQWTEMTFTNSNHATLIIKIDPNNCKFLILEIDEACFRIHKSQVNRIAIRLTDMSQT